MCRRIHKKKGTYSYPQAPEPLNFLARWSNELTKASPGAANFSPRLEKKTRANARLYLAIAAAKGREREREKARAR